MAKLTKDEKDRFKAEKKARRNRGRKPTHFQKQDAERSRLWVLARLNLPSGECAKDVL